MKKITSVVTAFALLILCGGVKANAANKRIVDSREALGDLYTYFHEGSAGCFGGIESYQTRRMYNYTCLYLKSFGLLPETFDPNGEITKRDMLGILLKIKKNHSNAVYIAKDEEEARESADIFKGSDSFQRVSEGFFESNCMFEDIPEDSDDFFFAFQLWSAGLLRGTVIDGKQYALLDNKATYGDTVSFISRLFIANPYFSERDMENYMREIGYTDNIMFHFAEEIELINDDSLLELYPTQVSLEQWNDKISARIFCDLLYKALHIPTFSTEHLGEKFYYINDLLADPDSIYDLW